MTQFSSTSDFRAQMSSLPKPSASAIEAAKDRDSQLTKPPGALGRLEEMAFWYAGWRGLVPERLENKQCLIFAGNHGVAAKGVSAFPPEVTIQMVANFRAGGAAINQLCDLSGVSLAVHELSLDTPTQDFTDGPALSEDALLDALNIGAAAVDPEAELLVLGEMGIGNTTIAAALSAALLGGSASDWTGPGTGLNPEGVSQKASIVEAGLLLHKAGLSDPVEVMRCLGGRETAAIAGALAAARMLRIPVILDGYIVCAAALPLLKMAPDALDHCLAGHISAEPAHRKLVDAFGKSAVLDLGLRLGEGSGALVALSVLEAALACHAGMSTFAEAGVSDKT